MFLSKQSRIYLVPLTILFSGAFSLSNQAAAQTAPQKTVQANSISVSVHDLPNFAMVAPGIYRGAAPTVMGLKTLRNRGIHTVIDLRISPRQVKQEKIAAEQMGFTWINLPMGSDPPTKRQVKQFLETLKRAPTEPVFVHCQHGADRTGCMIGIWRITEQGWTFPAVWKEMRHYGFNPHWTKLTESVKYAARHSPTMPSSTGR